MAERPEPYVTICFVRDLAFFCLGVRLCLSGYAPTANRIMRQPYYAALREADKAWALGHLELSQMEAYLAGLLEAQLRNED